MDEYEVNIVDGRNADHRRPTGNVYSPGMNRLPVRTVYTQAPQPQQAQMAPQIYYAAPPPGWNQSHSWGHGLLGKPGVVVDMVAQIFAALMPLPAAPVATSEVATDVQNLITYQQAIAQYAKRDEQVRTLGNLIVKLLG
jgi:hypothetical protein